MQTTTSLWLFTSLLFASLSIPLILGKVPPNRWYGFRVPKTFSSERIWYAANRASGYGLLGASVAIALSAILTSSLLNPSNPTAAKFVNWAVLVSAVSIAVVHSFLTLRRL